MSAPAIEVDDVTVRYGNVIAVDRASLRVPAGTVCGLVGMNGAGKSSLLAAIMGAVPLAQGRISIEGAPAATARRAARIAYVPQAEALDWTFPLSVREVVTTGRYGHLGPLRRPRRADRLAVDEALARTELTELAQRQIGALSGGQRKRAFVARCLAQEARVLLLDEPFAGVDKRTEASMSRMLRELAAEGRSILISTHDLHALPALCDEVVLFRHRPLLHASPGEALRPENLARTFGFDILSGEDER